MNKEDYFKYYIQGSDHYLIPKDVFDDVKKAIKDLQQENQELKKQLEEANKKLYLCTPEIPQNIHGKYVSYVDLVNEMYELKKQQQEFINYLEEEKHKKEKVKHLLNIMEKQKLFLNGLKFTI